MENYTEFKKLNLNEKIEELVEMDKEVCIDYLKEDKDLSIFSDLEQVIDVIKECNDGFDLMRTLSNLDKLYNYYDTEFIVWDYYNYECYDNLNNIMNEHLDDEDLNEIYKRIMEEN